MGRTITAYCRLTLVWAIRTVKAGQDPLWTQASLGKQWAMQTDTFYLFLMVINGVCLFVFKYVFMCMGVYRVRGQPGLYIETCLKKNKTTLFLNSSLVLYCI